MNPEGIAALKRNLVFAALALVMIHGVGTAGFYWIADGSASVFDAFYMTFITVATIGYAETVDLSGNDAGRLFNVAIAVAGIGFMWVMFSNFTALLLARTMDPRRQRERLIRELARMHDHYIVCGLGRIGANVARELRATGKAFVAIEQGADAIEHYRQHWDPEGEVRILPGDASEDGLLEAAGVRHARGVFAVTGEDSQNMLISLTARQLNPAARVVARVHEVRNIEKCRRAGADEIVSPDFAGALQMASAMLRPLAAGFIDEVLHRPGAMRLVDIAIPAGAAPRALGDLELRAAEYLVVGLRRGQGELLLNPGRDALIEGGDVLIALASPAGMLVLQQRLG